MDQYTPKKPMQISMSAAHDRTGLLPCGPDFNTLRDPERHNRTQNTDTESVPNE
jgi:hypothetical protein